MTDHEHPSTYLARSSMQRRSTKLEKARMIQTNFKLSKSAHFRIETEALCVKSQH